MKRSMWSNLHPDEIWLIAKKVKENLCDLVKMSAVCRNWRDCLVENGYMGCVTTVDDLRGVASSLHHPKLMLPRKGDDDNSREFLDWKTEGGIVIHQLELHGLQVFGSGYGWLVTGGDNIGLNGGYGIQLLNPITKDQKLLPYNPMFEPYDGLLYPFDNIRKAIIIGNPSATKDCTIVIFTEYYFFSLTGPGDHAQEWTMMATDNILLADIEYHNDLLYVLDDKFESIEVWDLVTGLRVSRGLKPDEIEAEILPNFTNLLLVSGVLMAVFLLSPSELMVYELQEVVDGEHSKWVRVRGLGDCCIFVGMKSGMALSPVPPNSGFRSNCVYFSYLRRLTVFDMSDGSSEVTLLDKNYAMEPSTWLTFNPERAAWQED